MACKSPLWIRNRRYYDPKDPCKGLRARDDHRSALALRPYDIARQWVAVPCGKCEDCIRRLRNDWYVRLERELRYCKDHKQQAVFVTLTIKPSEYERALSNPTDFIRRWNESIRRELGHSLKHAYFQEFGEHPTSGGPNRLHFHGFIFNLTCGYGTLHRLAKDFGFLWIGKATHKRARYTVKYVCKQLDLYDKNGNLIVDPDARDIKKYTRKFISPGVGNYLGDFARPSATVKTWSYMDWRKRITYDYTIPRYYDRYLSEKSRLIREVASADAYSRFSRDRLVKYVVDFCVKAFLPTNSLSHRAAYSWMNKRAETFNSAGSNDYAFTSPVWIDSDILDYWKQIGLSVPHNLLTKFHHLWQDNLRLAT